MTTIFSYKMTFIFTFAFVVILSGLIIWSFYPKFLETLEYEVEISEGPFQVRQYKKFLETKIQTTGSQNEALRNGFIPLARFIGANNRSNEKISMTVPVIQRKGEKIGNWFVSFSMPSKYSLKNLPLPHKDELLQEQVPERLMAAIKFSGNAMADMLDLREAELRQWIQQIGYESKGRAIYFFYNDPITPGFLRRNEVLLEVKKSNSRLE